MLCLPLAGFLLRSTNVRNAFEIAGPLGRLINALTVDPEKQMPPLKLVLSSEWDYSPLMYGHVGPLPGYVLIGLPAPESANPLLVPLAGHEIAHAIWRNRGIERRLQEAAQAAVIAAISAQWDKYLDTFPLLRAQDLKKGDLETNLFAVETWEQARTWSLRQAEETFCDFVGFLVFGESFLLAFSYLLSPGYGGRAMTYPTNRVRIERLTEFARRSKIRLRENYGTEFAEEEALNLIPSDEFRLRIADKAVEALVHTLENEAQAAVESASLPPRSDAEERRILTRLRRGVPPERCLSFADILNAGWRAYTDRTLWKDMPHVLGRRDIVLKELLLKTIEVYEIERRLEEGSNT